MAVIEAKPAAHTEHDSHGHSAANNENLKFAWWLYLASEVVIFTTLIAGYLVYAVNHYDVVKEVHEASGVFLVALNTFLLLASSWAMVMGLRSIQLGNQKGLIQWIGITAAIGALFVFLQGVEYTILYNEGVTLYHTDGALSEFGARFYAPTAFHGLHVIIGVLWAIYIIVRARQGKYSKTNYIGIEVFGLYWHFVDVVWIFLFTFIYLI
jgi:heme/copper-type cytochrome/quinol oxidase subunit 3